MNTAERIDLLKFCMAWHKPLSDEFIMKYCEIKTRNSLYTFAWQNDISVARFRRKKKNKRERILHKSNK